MKSVVVVSDDEKPFVKFQGMSERKTPVTVEGDNLSEMVRKLVKLVDSGIEISFDHHTTNVRHWHKDEVRQRSADELLDTLEKSLEDVKEGRTYTLDELKEELDDV